MSNASIARAVDTLIDSQRIVPRQLIATIYGDMLTPRRGGMWLGSLVETTKLFGIAEYLSRTTAQRMVKAGVLETTRVGKLSFYEMSADFLQSTQEYYNRVYGAPTDNWPGIWRLLLTGAAKLKPAAYTSLRRELLWRGVGQLAPHVFISAATSVHSLEEILTEARILSRVQILEANLAGHTPPEIMQRLVADAWDVASIEGQYKQFISRYRIIWSRIEKEQDLNPELGFQIRILLMNEYRRIALRDPKLPRMFLPASWAGDQAFQLARAIYQIVLEPSEAYFRSVVQTPHGPLPPIPAEVYARFGGLDRQ